MEVEQCLDSAGVPGWLVQAIGNRRKNTTYKIFLKSENLSLTLLGLIFTLSSQVGQSRHRVLGGKSPGRVFGMPHLFYQQ